MTALDAYGPPATDELPAGQLVSEGLCPHCHDDLQPTGGWGWCAGCELGWRCRRSGPDTYELAVTPPGWVPPAPGG